MTSDGKSHNKNTREICLAKGDHNRSDSWGRHMWRGPRGCPLHLGVGSGGKWSVCATTNKRRLGPRVKARVLGIKMPEHKAD